MVDDHITGVLTEHQAGRFLDMPPAGIRVRGRKSTPGRYFQVAEPGLGWGGTDVTDPLEIIERIDRQGRLARAAPADGVDHRRGRRLVRARRAAAAGARARCRRAIATVVERIAENCEPALTTVLFMAGAGGSLRAGVTENPVRLTRSVKQALTRVTCGGAPVYVWPGGGITLMVDVTRMPEGSFGYVPTPALVAPIEFTLAREDYAALGGHLDSIVPLEDVLAERAPDAARPGTSTTPGRCGPGRAPRGAHDRRGAGRVAGRRPATAPAARPDRHRRRGVRQRRRASARPTARRRRAFATILAELVAELAPAAPADHAPPACRSRVRSRGAWSPRSGRIAAQFVTPMAAVAGAVADEVLAAMLAGRTPGQGLRQRRRRHRAPPRRRASACGPGWSPIRACARALDWTARSRSTTPCRCAASRPRAGAAARSRSASPMP